MKKILIASASFLAVALVGLWGFVLLAGRDAAPPDEAEFRAERPEVAPEQNAFTYFLQATNSLVETTNVLLVADYLAGKAADDGALREWVGKNAECLALVKRGTECAICLTPPLETIETLVPYLNPWLHMGRILEARARLAQSEGRFAEAADDLAVGMRFGHLVQKDATGLIVYLGGVAIFSSSAEQALELARDPVIPPEVLAWLATELEKVGPFAGGLAQAFKAEHRMTCNIVDDLFAKQEQRAFPAYPGFNANRWVAWLLQTTYSFKPNQTKRDLAVVHRLSIGNVSRIYADMELFDVTENECGRWAFLRPNAIGNYLFQFLMLSQEALLETKCRAEGLLAGAKLVVACHRFERERGRFPNALPELVPDFLKEVPRDPYDGAPFRYSAEKGLVWAVGKNLTDEGGSMRVSDADLEYEARRDRRRAEDFVFEIQPTTKAE